MCPIRFHCFTLTLKVAWPFPCRPWKESFAFQSATMSGLVLARYWPGVFVRPPDRRAGVHLHFRHVHIQFEPNVADIDELTLCISEFDQGFVVAATKLTLR